MSDIDIMKHPFIINMGGGMITYLALLRAVMESNLHWEMHPAQLVGLELTRIYMLSSMISSEEKKKALSISSWERYTLFGLPVTVNLTMPKNRIELVQKDKVTFIIENLAIPSVYGLDDRGENK